MTQRTVMDLVLELAQGNPGAATVCANFMNKEDHPILLALEHLGIRGSDIWILYKDVCNQNLLDFEASILLKMMQEEVLENTDEHVL